jgi:hypothetical protein
MPDPGDSVNDRCAHTALVLSTESMHKSNHHGDSVALLVIFDFSAAEGYREWSALRTGNIE